MESICSTGWQSWMQLENFSTWHNVPMASLANGFKGLNTELEFNNSLHVKHIQNMVLDHFEDLNASGGQAVSPMMLDSHVGLIMSLIASATATFF